MSVKKKKFYLVRHAIAEDRDVFKQKTQKNDIYRPLTKEGKKKFLKLVQKLKKKKINLKRVFHSPFLRCVETAQLIQETIPSQLISTKSLGHGHKQSDSLDLLKKLKKNSAFVGHEPELSMLLLELGLRAKPFKKGEWRCLQQKTKKRKKIKTITYKVLWALKASRN